MGKYGGRGPLPSVRWLEEVEGFCFEVVLKEGRKRRGLSFHLA